MRSLYAMLGSVVTIIASYLVVYILIGIFYFSKFSPQETFSPGFLVYATGIIAFPVLTILVSIIYFKWYGNINVRGIAVGGVLGLWLYTLVNEYLFRFVPYSAFIQIMLDCIPLLLIIIGYKFVTHKLSDNKVKFTLLGMAIGWVVTYAAVIGMRAAQNSLTSYFHFDTFEKSIVLGVIAISGVAGWLLSKNTKKKIIKS
ncbi:hypothetical protein [Paenibacillus agilis]|uniref:Uncharacterized protein n=1 Tax=Paenibacillus agilis TaxID=3020863 RepID=A0A559J0R2_9BACL|nr:hypothetical protein [Paenibacillus agilis]TVX93479.1 hypothetical protein FPZ44_10685 [Paenibacillus agilis]